MAEQSTNPFAEMRKVVEATRPYSRSLLALAIHHPRESLTSDECLELALEMGNRRLDWHKQVTARSVNAGGRL